jgi:DNA-binding CsgD family transcriptional regulator
MPNIPERGQPLTPRELQVLNQFCSGTYTAKGVARKLGISHRTIEVHMSNAIVKLGAQNQLHAVLIHDRAGRTDQDPLRQAAEQFLASCKDGNVADLAGYYEDIFTEALGPGEKP